MVEVGADTKGAEKGVSSFSDKLNGTAQKLGAVGAGLSLGVTAPLLGIAGAALNTAMGFEQSMNILGQVTGATASDMASMQEQALALGASTVFSAGEAAEGMLELGKAGMGTEQIMAAIPGVMDLAAAGGVSLGEAAKVTAATLNAFGLEASESARIADLLAGTANASAADISDLSLGMQQAGFAFNMANQPVDNLAASLAILTNVGLTGSDAGTALKNAFMRMMNPTEEASGLMQELGINFYDAAGNMLPLENIIDNLNVATAGLTAEQRDQALATIFLSDGMKAMIPLMDQGKEGFLGIRDTVTEAGAATDVADARMAGLAGAVERMKGAVETFMVTAALPFLDSLSGILIVVADAVEGFGGLPQPVMNAALAFLGVLAAAGPVLVAISGLAAGLAFLLSPIGLVVAGVALLAAAWASNFGNIQGKTQELIAAVTPFFTGLAGQAQALAGQIMTTSQQIGEGFGRVQSAVADAGLASLEAREAWSTLPGILGQLAPQVTGAAAAFELLWSVLSGSGAGSGQIAAWKDMITDGFGPEAVGTVMLFIDSFRAGVGNLQAIWAQVVAFLTPSFTRVQEALTNVGGGFGELGPQLSALWAAAQPVFAGIATAAAKLAQIMGVTLVGAVSLFANLFASIINGLPGIVGTMIDQMTVMLTGLSTIVGGLVKTVSALLAGDWAGAWEGAKQVFFGFTDMIGGTLFNLGTLIGQIFGIIAKTIAGFMSDLGINIDTEVAAITTAVQGFWDWLTGLTWGDVWTALKDSVADFTADLSFSIPPFVWADFVPDMAWTEHVTNLAWADYVADLVWGTWLDVLAWLDYIDTLPWVDFINPLAWIDFITSINWIDFIADIQWTDFVADIAWLDFITDITWADFVGDVAWGDFVPDIKWGDFVPDVNWSDFIKSINPFDSNATGSNYYQGGTTWVGERGPELVTLPRGSQIHSNRHSMEMAGDGGGVTINIENVTMGNDMDIHAAAAKLAREFQRRVRR